MMIRLVGNGETMRENYEEKNSYEENITTLLHVLPDTKSAINYENGRGSNEKRLSRRLKLGEAAASHNTDSYHD